MTMPKTTEKPREWIIFGVACAEKGSAAYDNFQWNEGNVHVIEYAAFEKLKAELAESEAKYNFMVDSAQQNARERDTLKAKLAEVEAALKYDVDKIEAAYLDQIAKLQNQLTREREAAKVMREALELISESIDYYGDNLHNKLEGVQDVRDALAKADEIRGNE